MLRHPQKPRTKNKQKSAQKAMQVVSSFGTLFCYFWIFSDVLFSGFFRQPLGEHFFHFECQTGSPKHPFGGHFGDFLVSGWKRENGVFVLVLARFRGLEGVRILTISGVFPSLHFKRHLKDIFLSFLRFLAPFGLPLGGHFATFFRFFEHVKKNMIFELPSLPRRHRAQTP